MLQAPGTKVKTRTEWLAHVALIALIVAVATNVAIGLTLKDRLDRLRPAPAVEAGALLTEVTGTDVSGKTQTVLLRGTRPTILYVSRRGCGWCERNHRNLQAIGLQASSRFQILELSAAGVGPSGSPAFGVERLAVSEDLLRQIGARGTPYMVLLSPEGRVIESWVGAFGPRTAPSVARTLQVELPGLIP